MKLTVSRFSIKIQKEVQLQHILKLVKNFETHDTCEDCKAMGSSPAISEKAHAIIQKEFAHLVMNKPEANKLRESFIQLNTTNRKKRIKLAYFISISGVCLLLQTGRAGCGELLATFSPTC